MLFRKQNQVILECQWAWQILQQFYSKIFLNFDPRDPEWLDRDRFVLSNGHGSMLLYACLYLTGYKNISMQDIKNFRQLGSPTAGHPEYKSIKGIETTTGPLSQGIANGVGMALAERILNSKFGNDIINHNTFVFAGDGCFNGRFKS